MLHEILNRLLGHQAAPAAPAPKQQQPKTDLPNIGRLSDAIAQYQGKLPMDNLDGTFENLQPNQGQVFQSGGQWAAPLKPGLTMPRGIAHFDPLSTNDKYTDDTYPVLPINPASVPALKSYLPYMQQGGAQ